ncbi:hypothetical protein ACFL1H_05090 [Nanoarchaeota archaeon]
MDRLRDEIKTIYSKIISNNSDDQNIAANFNNLVEMMNGAIKSVIALNLNK